MYVKITIPNNPNSPKLIASILSFKKMVENTKPLIKTNEITIKKENISSVIIF